MTEPTPLTGPSAGGEKTPPTGRRPRCYGWQPYDLQKHYSAAELLQWMNDIRADPASRQPHQHGTTRYIYSAAAVRQLDALAWAYYHATKRP